MTWHGTAHLVSAGIGFVCLVAAGFVIAASFARMRNPGWAWFSRCTAALFAISFGVLASGAGGAGAILAFTAAVVLSWAWLAAVSVKLYGSVGATAR